MKTKPRWQRARAFTDDGKGYVDIWVRVGEPHVGMAEICPCGCNKPNRPKGVAARYATNVRCANSGKDFHVVASRTELLGEFRTRCEWESRDEVIARVQPVTKLAGQ